VRPIKAEDICVANCGNYVDTEFGFSPGPLFTLGFEAINRTATFSYAVLPFC
jgi:hypothetical protein